MAGLSDQLGSQTCGPSVASHDLCEQVCKHLQSTSDRKNLSCHPTLASMCFNMLQRSLGVGRARIGHTTFITWHLKKRSWEARFLWWSPLKGSPYLHTMGPSGLGGGHRLLVQQLWGSLGVPKSVPKSCHNFCTFFCCQTLGFFGVITPIVF